MTECYLSVKLAVDRASSKRWLNAGVRAVGRLQGVAGQRIDGQEIDDVHRESDRDRR